MSKTEEISLAEENDGAGRDSNSGNAFHTMSWLFGLNKTPTEAPQVPILGEDASEGAAAADGGVVGSVGGGDEGHRSGPYSFDSSALERAAKAAKVSYLIPTAKTVPNPATPLFFQDLERSKWASQALDLSRQQETTKQHEQMAKIKEYEMGIEQVKIEGKRVDGEERRRTLEEEAKIAKHKSEYQDQLARRRYEDQLVQQQRMQEENLRKQEESVAKQEAMRKATLEQEMELRAKADSKRIAAEMTAKAKVERENQDLYLEQIRLKVSISLCLDFLRTFLWMFSRKAIRNRRYSRCC